MDGAIDQWEGGTNPERRCATARGTVGTDDAKHVLVLVCEGGGRAAAATTARHVEERRQRTIPAQSARGTVRRTRTTPSSGDDRLRTGAGTKKTNKRGRSAPQLGAGR